MPQTTQQIVQQITALRQDERIMILAPIVRGRKGEYKKDLEKLARQGFVRARIDGFLRSLDEDVTLDKRRNHTIEVVIDRLVVKPGMNDRLEASIDTAAKLADGLVLVAVVNGTEQLYSQKLACPNCGASIPKLEPRSFSFNSPYGACELCNGLGSKWSFDAGKVVADPSRPLLDGALVNAATSAAITQAVTDYARRAKISISKKFEVLPRKSQINLLEGDGAFRGILAMMRDTFEEASEIYREWLLGYMSPAECELCRGARLKRSALAVQVKGVSIGEFTALPIGGALETARRWKLTDREAQIAGRVVEEIIERLQFLCAVGLDYLNLQRSAATLSGGEAQRIRLATQIGTRLRGVLYVLDEPSIGLHPRDNDRLLDTLSRLRDLGNTVLVVEHDEETIRRADFVIDLGPGAGRLGGGLVASGKPPDIEANTDSLTGRYLSGVWRIPVPRFRRHGNGSTLAIRGAREHNLKNVDVEFPLGMFIAVTGVSGSGKSTLVHDILYRALSAEVYGSHAKPGAHGSIEGIKLVDKVIEIDQSPIGRTPRSNPATYTGAFTPIRDLYAMLPESRERGYKPGRFSFNVKGGRCEACQGDGVKCIEMNFLPDVYVTCDVCHGRRYNQETLEVKYKGHSIADLLGCTVTEAAAPLENIPQIYPKLKTLIDVGLGYIHLGQSATTLSGGEAQRIKLARELSRRQTGRTFYILDEPTTGLHFDDVSKLVDVLQKLVELGNTVLVIEHNLDIVKSADWVIDLGPEGGEKGGHVVATGTPEQVARVRRSHTGRALERVLGKGRAA
jgi:excinuclease ABC subunit A